MMMIMMIMNNETSHSYLHDTREGDDENVGRGEVADDSVDTRRSAPVYEQPHSDKTAADYADNDLNIQHGQARRFVEHRVSHVTRRLVDSLGLTVIATAWHCSVYTSAVITLSLLLSSSSSSSFSFIIYMSKLYRPTYNVKYIKHKVQDERSFFANF